MSEIFAFTLANSGFLAGLLLAVLGRKITVDRADDSIPADEPVKAEYPSVTIIIPCRNEEKFVALCLDSIIANDYPKDKIEVLVIDGQSDDNTRAIIHKYLKEYDYITLLENYRKIQTVATNIGILKAKGKIVIRMDAHATYSSDYISKCVFWLRKSRAGCVGGRIITMPGNNSIKAKAIAFVLSHGFGVGNSYFRIGISKPSFVDTVPFGCYDKKIFKEIGLFNESLNRTDDIEFNYRLGKTGGKILLVPEIVSYYYSRPDFIKLSEQNFGNGFWITYSLKYVRNIFKLRHLIPLFFILALILFFCLSFVNISFFYVFLLIIGTYSLLNCAISISIATKHGWELLPYLLWGFITIHLSYGIGSLYGLAKIIMEKTFATIKFLGSRKTGKA